MLASIGASLQADLVAELARIFGVPESWIQIPTFKCGSIVAVYVVSFPSGTDLAQVSALRCLCGMTAAGRVTTAAAAATTVSSAASTSFTAKWGTVTNSTTSGITVLQPSSLCPIGSPASALCPLSPPPPQPEAAKKSSAVGLIVGASFGGGVALVLVVFVLLYIRRGGRGRYATNQVGPEPRQSAGGGYPRQSGSGGYPPATQIRVSGSGAVPGYGGGGYGGGQVQQRESLQRARPRAY
ncbi:hypothetical protein GPECTOR_53g134 [Gonium pectorale]|uniref:Uncharacterized protein n=1 Tax=Gonium pectorale TaxID=33097 RepID=A0A150G6T6_GONPE|nr:hypothetical protein GPECTOR_53g134 [Gonium pectorale]|eukprot:KXZ45548.1 hypothetical protein GPECTOR_53g134 [Gonium pectorale]